MALKFSTSYLEDAIEVFRMYKQLADRAIQQVPDGCLNIALDNESNSIAITAKHIAGNLRSRWTDFLTTDGEKPTRNRDSEFEDPPANREQLLAIWEPAWQTLFDTLGSLSDEDLGRNIRIRGEAHSVMQAVNRSITHIAYHVGQITFLCKHFSAAAWKPLTVPRGKSAEFNARVSEGKASQR
jgi:hypothetical protein